MTDGLTNTIFFGEVRAGCSIHADTGGWSNSHMWGMTSTLIPMNYDSCHPSTGTLPAGLTDCNRKCTWNTEFGFRSLHPGGANFALGDASVRFIAQTIDMWTYQYLGAKNDGMPVGSF